LSDNNAKTGLVIDEEEAEIVRWIFDMYANEGLSIRRIILALKKKGILSPTGLDHWAPTSLRRLLKNPYIGCLYYNKTKLLPNNRRQKRKKSEMVPISTTPIVEEWVFDLAQNRFEENMERVRRQPKRFYLLGGLIISSDCGRPYVTQTYPAGKQRRVYDSQIYRHRMTSGHRTNTSILAKIIEP